MKKIYLLSGPLKEGGFPRSVKKELKNDLFNKNYCVLICTKPTEYTKNDEYKNRMKRDLNNVGFSGEIVLLDKRISQQQAFNILSKADLIYLIGGNPFTQIEYIQTNKFDKFIIESSALVIGTSAGAMNLCCQVYCSKDEEFLESIFYKGLGLVDLIIDPHFDINNLEQVKEIKLQSKNKEIIGLPDDSAIIICNNTIKYMGKKYVFKNGNLEI